MAEIKVFISSVQAEFAQERRKLYEYIRQDALLGQFFEPFIFENMPAVDLTAPQAYLKEAASCDIYLGLYGVRYGYEDAEGVSPTEREYDTATEHHAHRLIYILRSGMERHPKEAAFISKVEQAVVRRSFGDYEELRTAVYTSLVRYLEQKEIVRKLPFDASANLSATWEDIDREKVRRFVERAQEKRKSKIQFSDGLESIFSGIHVLTEDGRLTNSAILLFGKDPQRFFRTSEVKCAQFYGTKVEKPIKNYQVYQGSLFELIDQAVGFVMSRIDASVGTRKDGTDAPIHYELPETAVAEAIANAIAHRDYTSNASVQVMLFRDRLEVWNPGRLPYGMTVDKLRSLHSSDPTNPVIAHPLFLTGNIEHLGTGTTDMIRDCEAEGLRSPEFIQEEDFRVVIWRKVTEPVAEKVIEPTGKVIESGEKVIELRLTKKQLRVLDFCEEMPRSAQEILEFVGVKYQTKTVQQYVTKLVNAGKLRPTRVNQNSPERKYITAKE